MAQTWRVMLSSKWWNQSKYEDDWHEKPEVRRLPQSKGNTNMKKTPQKGDLAKFILKGKIVMEGVVDNDGFESGSYHQIHSCNIGDNREHSIPREFVWVNIIQVNLDQRVRVTGQQTWIKWKEDMLI
jgi:hypothetical protein